MLDLVTIKTFGLSEDELTELSTNVISQFKREDPIKEIKFADHGPDEIMRVELAMNKAVQDPLILDLYNLGEAENPSVIKFRGRLLMITSFAWGVVEGHGADGNVHYKWINHTHFPFYNEEPYLGIATKGDFLEGHTDKDILPGVDPRVLYVDDSHLLISFNNNHYMNVMGQAEFSIDRGTGKAQIGYHCDRIKFGNIEKNWMAFKYDDEGVTYVQRINPLHVVKTKKDDDGQLSAYVISEAPSVNIPWWQGRYGEFRGGTNALLVEDVYLAFFHSSTQLPGNFMKTYFMGAFTFTKEAPYRLLGMSQVPIMHDRLYTGEWSQFKNRRIDYVVFPTNFFIEGDDLYLSFGSQDRTAYVAQMKLKAVLDSINPIIQTTR